MLLSKSKSAVLTLSAASLFFTACGDAGVTDSSEATIPDAPGAAIQTVISEFAKGDGGILWRAMPATYQTDVNALAQLAGTKIDPELYDQCFALIGRLGKVADKQQAFIVNTPMAQRSEEEKVQLTEALPSLVGLLETLSTSKIASSTGLQSFDGQVFFDTTVTKLVSYADALSQIAGETETLSDYENVVVSVVEATDTEATLQVVLPGEVSEPTVFSKVEGRWVPADMAEDWTTTIADARANLEAMSPEDMAAQKPQIMGVLTMIDGVLTQIDAAETQEQFDQSLQGAMMPIMGLMMMGQGMGGGFGAPAAPSSMPLSK